MALIIEDGSIVSGANSFVTVDEVKDYADLRAMTIPLTTSKIEAAAILSMDYMKSKQYVGQAVSDIQPLPFPRLYLENYLSTVIPQDVKNAQIELIIASFTNTLIATDNTPNIKREKVGELETEYAGFGFSQSFSSARVDMYLSKFIRQIGVVRI